ncbi:hypothetical protein PFICI_05559 [Pestalotiopsis fici W106-1]|uniref:FAD-binding PCMH-type domain-containing protein n=1 Tax=Pestalotiopsis fici (strain W106-1 / CGMCC3.15140) TaxID=1229662 RepID=W3XC66_PESFW|nr:uncharacterized protein PFICI_05559 [Pestalotiopsis fici W106-1]ETS83683.1 hypothetical protein PFICI_05559 [Pestalotiopsis fici W106-1]
MKSLVIASIIAHSTTFISAVSASVHDAECCHALHASALGSNVYFPKSSSYDDRLDSYWSRSAALAPTCMVLPTCTEDVAHIIRTIVANNCSFGVRSGGHGSFAYSNSVDEGITIDFGFINKTTYNSDTKIASVPPGSQWQQVYETLAPYGVTVTGGRAGTVGVAGFLTGGGNSFHSASHGFGCDNVHNFEVVLADGSIVDANAEAHADLWQGLKGGSGNLGLVTRFDMYVIDFPDPGVTDIWGGVVGYDLGATDAVIDAYIDFADNVYKDQNSSTLPYLAYVPEAGGMILNVALDNTINAAFPPAFDGFLSVPGITATSLRSAPMQEITAELGLAQPYGFRHLWFSSGYKNDARIMRYIVQKHKEIVARLVPDYPADSGFNTLCLFQPITQTLVGHSAAKGGNVLGLEDRVKDGNGVMFLLGIGIHSAEDEAKLWPIFREWFDDVDSYATSIGANWNWHYLNYANLAQDSLASYGKASVETIRRVSEKYDPGQVFQKLRKSGFKIPAEVHEGTYGYQGANIEDYSSIDQKVLG